MISVLFELNVLQPVKEFCNKVFYWVLQPPTFYITYIFNWNAAYNSCSGLTSFIGGGKCAKIPYLTLQCQNKKISLGWST